MDNTEKITIIYFILVGIVILVTTLLYWAKH